jgi:hypothetical protein
LAEGSIGTKEIWSLDLKIIPGMPGTNDYTCIVK